MSMVPISTDAEQAYRTPGFVYDHYHRQFNYILDLAADFNNTLCPYFYDDKSDALSRDWVTDLYRYHETSNDPTKRCGAWCNPPFELGSKFARLMRRKAADLLNFDTFTMLCLSSSIGTQWYAEVAPYCVTEIITPRFGYVHPDPDRAAREWAAKKPDRTPEEWKPSAPAGSMTLIFNRLTVAKPQARPLRLYHVKIKEPKS
jgi:phage N-6-adenine-methyltransferase